VPITLGDILSAMKRITFSGDADLIRLARAKAKDRNTTLNDEIRRWLTEYAEGSDKISRAEKTIAQLQSRYGTGGRKFTRDELNERAD
jgi:hypothetical protein